MRAGQCARTSPCAHARHMARRLALLALLACAVALHPHPRSRYTDDYSDTDSADPLVLWDDYDDSRDTTPPPRLRTTPPVSKVILRNKRPKVNVTVKDKSDDKKIIKTTNINIESHTNFIETKPPMTRRPSVEDGQHYVLVHSSEHQVTIQTTKKPEKTRRPPTTRRPTTRRPTTRRPTTRRSTTTRRPTTRPKRRNQKTTKAPQNRKTTCAPKTTGWLTSFFQSNKAKKTPKKPEKSGWFLGGFFISSCFIALVVIRCRKPVFVVVSKYSRYAPTYFGRI